MHFANDKRSSYLATGFAILTLAVLSYLSFKNFLLFHALAEGFSICIAFCIFVVAWNSRKFSDNDYLLFIGCALLFVAFLDLIHTFAYKGMNIFGGLSANPATQLWIAARYMESISLLIAPLWLARKLRLGIAALGFSVVTALVLAAVFYWPVFPNCFVDGIGLTPFKKGSEYLICLILGGALVSLRRHRHLMDEKVNRLVAAAIVVTILSELCFTFYVSVYGFSNIAGHVLKIISFYLIYKAIIENGLRRPYDTLFRNLKESEERYQQIFETNQAVKLLIDPQDGTIVAANQAACDFYGYSKEEILKKKITDINMLPPDQVHHEMASAKTVDQSMFTFPRRLASGEMRDVQVYSGPVKTADRTLLFSIIHDVTDQKLTEEALRESEEKFRSLVEQASEMLFLHDLKGNIIDVNLAAIQHTGYSREELKRMTVFDIDPNARDRGDIQNYWEALKIEDSPVSFEVRHKRKNGSIYSAEVVSSKIALRNNHYILVLAHDITERKKMEEHLQRTRQMEAITTLTGGIAHDYNNLMSIIMGNLSMAMEEVEAGSDLGDFLNEIDMASRKIRDLTHELMSLSKDGKPVKEVGPLNELLKSAINAIPADSHISVNEVISKDLWQVPYDSYKTGAVFRNVVTNAVEAMPDGGALTVKAENLTVENEDSILPLNPGDFVHISIEDQGKGIPEEQMEKIFDPYFSTKERGVQKGMGLGLATAYAIITQHGGHIQIDSSPGAGTTVNLYFPAKCGQEQMGGTITSEDQKTSPAKRLLVMDDEEMLRNLAQKMLERIGYVVETVGNGLEAIENYKQQKDSNEPFDAVILDLTIKGGIGGEQTMRELLKIDPNVKAIVCSGYFNDPVMKDFNAYGFMGAIAKPYEKKALKEVLERLL